MEYDGDSFAGVFVGLFCGERMTDDWGSFACVPLLCSSGKMEYDGAGLSDFLSCHCICMCLITCLSK